MAITEIPPTIDSTIVAAADDHGNQAASASILTMAAAQRGTVSGVQDSDYFKITVEAGHTYAFALSNVPQGSHVSNGLLRLEGTTGNAAANAPLRFHPNGYGSHYGVLTASYTGDYYLAVGTHAAPPDKAVEYTLTAQEFAPDDIGNDRNSAGQLAVDGKVSGKLDYTGDVDWYKVQLQPGVSYALMLRGDRGSEGTLPVTATTEGLRLFSASGIELPFRHTTGDGARAITATAGGDYYVAVDATDRIHGVSSGSSYTLHLQANHGDTAAPVLVSDTSSPVGLFDDIVIAFNEPVGRSVYSGMVIDIALLDASGSLVNGSVLSTGSGYVFNPSDHLMPGATYKVILPGITDVAGNAYQGKQPLAIKVRGADTQGGAGNDLLMARGDGVRIDGGDGCDMVVYDQHRSGAEVALKAGEVHIKPFSWSATDVLAGVERVLFDDTAVAFDTAGAGGQAYRLYQAAFNRAPDQAGIGYWIAQLDKGASLHEVAQSFVGSQEFAALYGDTPTNAAFIDKLYQNVLHRAGDQAGVDYWNGILATGTTRAEVLAWFSEGAENQAAVLKLIGNGFEYTPYG